MLVIDKCHQFLSLHRTVIGYSMLQSGKTLDDTHQLIAHGGSLAKFIIGKLQLHSR